MKDWYIGHIEDCEYCYRVDESICFTREKKDKLIDKHTMAAFEYYGDAMYEIYKEQQYA